MDLVNLILVDLTAQTVNFNCQLDSVEIEDITYDNNTTEVTLYSVTDIILTSAQFYNLIAQINIFQTALIYNFSPGNAFISPFNSYVSEEKYDTGIFGQVLTCNEEGGDNLMDFQATPSDDKVYKNKRNSDITIPFSEFVMMLTSLTHYNQSVRYIFT